MKKEVLEKLYGSKVELSEVKVDLANYDFKAYKTDADKLFTTYRDNLRNALNQAKKEVDNYQNNLFELKAKMDNEYKDLTAKAKELGVTIQGSPKENEYNQMIDILDRSRQNALEKAKSLSMIM